MTQKKIDRKQSIDKKSKFAKVGFILGIVAIATSVLGIGGLVAIPGIVFSVLGFKTPHPEYYRKARNGLIFSIVAIAVAIIVCSVGGYYLAKFVYEFIGKP
ncbi:MAG: hypothetical protein MJ219_02245 [Mycoplasmoidaceae bacterium]|nr:hypothetical protein [Mycoplasmoidaceae bacterium]